MTNQSHTHPRSFWSTTRIVLKR